MVDRPLLTPEKDINGTLTQWVVFSNDTDIRMLKIFRRGFRHCFVMMQQDSRWILIDPRANKTDIHLLPHPSHFNFPRYYAEQGKTVVKIQNIMTPQKILPPISLSCVGAVKRLIGMHAWAVITPHQLYKKLLKIQNQKGS